jgi:uncharacterized protein YkwD
VGRLADLFRRLAAWLAAASAPPPGPPKPEPPGPPTDPNPPPPVAGDLSVLLGLHNSARAREGVRLLIRHDELDRAAQRHASWMAARRDVDHFEDPGHYRTFAQRVQREGYSMGAGGENIAAGRQTPERVFSDWWGSSGHRENVLDDDYWHAGFGVAADVNGSLYWCAVYARPLVRAQLRGDGVVGTVRVVVRLPVALVHQQKAL